MLTIDALKDWGADVETGLSRCINSEPFYLRLVKKVPSSGEFEKLYAALEAGDTENGFAAAHALKGVLANLSLDPVLRPVNEVTELLRAGTVMDYSELEERIKEEQRTLAAMCEES